MVMGREYHREYAKNWYHERRAEYVALLGGKCVACGSVDKLQFDHKDRSTKKFAIGKLFMKSQSVVREELEKCQLLCQPCHVEKSRPELREAARRRKWDRLLQWGGKVAVV